MTNLLAVFKINFYYISDIISFLTLFTIPGALILLLFKIKGLSFWEAVSLIIGFSLTFIMVAGLLINQSFISLGLREPLSTQPILVILDLLMVVIALFAYRRNKNLLLRIAWKLIIVKQLLLYLPPPIFVILSACGATSLNNNGSNFLTMIMLASIALYTAMITLLHKKIPPAIFSYSLYFIGLSLLLMTSLRSWFITGHDIQREYFAFQLTKQHYLWNINTYKDAYNASMSITILPTILSNFLTLSDVYVYKLVFQIVFAVCPVIIYLFLKKYTEPVLAFLACLYFLSFPTFYNDMPMLNRQEIGFIFFSLLLFTIFNISLSKITKRLLFIIFAFSTTISHYSTNYVLIFLSVSTFFLIKITNLTFTRKLLAKIETNLKITPITKTTDTSFITVFIITAILFFTFFWNTLYTKTSNNVSTLAQEVVNDLLNPPKTDSRAGETGYSLFMPHKVDPQKMLDEYIQDNIKQAKQKNAGGFFDANEYQRYDTHVLMQTKTPLTQIGNVLNNFKLPVFQLNAISRQLASALIQLFVFIGLFGFIFYANRKPLDKEYILLCISGVILLALQIMIPKLSTEYGLLRMFQQLLMLLSLPIVIATMALKKFWGEGAAISITAGTIILFFLTLTGFFSTMTGGYYPQMSLNNDGLYYNAYYVSEQFTAGVDWIKNNKSNYSVQADSSSALKLFSHSVMARNEIFPPIIRRTAYVFLAHADTKDNAIVSFNKSALIYNSPEPFLNDYKNLIYDNGTTKIYK